MKLVHCPLMGRGGTGRRELGGAAARRPLLVLPNVTAHPSTASVPSLLYNGPLLCSFNVPIKG